MLENNGSERLRLARALLLAVAVAAVMTPGGALAQAAKDAKDSGYQTSVPQAFLIDEGTGTVLFEKAADEPFAPASMAKIMTAAVVFEELKKGRLKLDDQFVVSENAWRKGGAPSGSSAMFAAVRSSVRVDDLLKGLLIQSGNDAAIVLAEGISGSEAAFADKMTKRAQELGLSKSNFTNATGLPDPAQKVSARDLAALARHVIDDYPEYYHYFGEREFTWNKIRQMNRNPLIAGEAGADGLKTGYIKESGYGLTGSTNRAGQRLIVVVGGAKTSAERATEASKLLEWGYRAFAQRELFPASAQIGEASVYGGEKGSVPLVAKGPVKVLSPRSATDSTTAQIVYHGPLLAPVETGKQVGTLKVKRGDILVLEVPLFTGEAVAKGGLGARALDGAIELSTGYIRRALKKI